MTRTEHVDTSAPICATCGHAVTTGSMAMYCPRRDRCEFWPEDEPSQEFIRGYWPQQTAQGEDK